MSEFSIKSFPANPLSVQGAVKWQSPSNIALIKYWGKRPIQLPANASISFTLSEANTKTSVEYIKRDNNQEWVDFYFEGTRAPDFAQRITKYLASIKEKIPFVQHYAFKIKSENSFPHSSGIASSASSMSALALCLCDIEEQIIGKYKSKELFYSRVSYLARLGSGSASRSVYPNVVSWGKSEHLLNSSDEYATPVKSHDSVFDTFHDDVLIVSEEKKSVSSSAGHALMETNRFAAQRYQQANEHMSLLIKAMQSGNLPLFGKIVEDEALSLHALMMCSDPSFILMEAGTLSVIKEIRKFREETSLPVYFTLDAGPNVHILYPDHIKEKANEFINSKLAPMTPKGRIIKDRVGPGPQKLK